MNHKYIEIILENSKHELRLLALLHGFASNTSVNDRGQHVVNLAMEAMREIKQYEENIAGNKESQ